MIRICPWMSAMPRGWHTLRHGHAVRSTRSPEYDVWASMIQRCTNPNHAQFKDYGGRGITVCQRWRDFANFIADMGPRPPLTMLERVKNHKGYSPANCRWATNIEQARNTRTTVFVTINRQRKPVPEWCEMYGVNRSTVYKRVKRSGWTWQRAITTPALWER